MDFTGPIICLAMYVPCANESDAEKSQIYSNLQEFWSSPLEDERCPFFEDRLLKTGGLQQHIVVVDRGSELGLYLFQEYNAHSV